MDDASDDVDDDSDGMDDDAMTAKKSLTTVNNSVPSAKTLMSGLSTTLTVTSQPEEGEANQVSHKTDLNRSGATLRQRRNDLA